MEDAKELAVSSLAQHFDYDLKATEAFYDAHAHSIPEGEDAASFLIDKIASWDPENPSASAPARRASSAAPGMSEIDLLAREIEKMQMSIRQGAYGAEIGDDDADIEYDTTPTEGIGSALKKGARWVKNKVSGKKSKSSSSSSKKSEDKEDKEDEDGKTRKSAAREIEALRRDVEKLKTKTRSTGFGEYSEDKSAALECVYDSPAAGGGDDDSDKKAKDLSSWHMGGGKKHAMMKRSEDYGSAAAATTASTPASRSDHYSYTMEDADDDALVAEIDRILKGNVKTIPRARMDKYDSRDREAEYGDFETEAQEKRFLMFGKSERVLDLQVMKFSHASTEKRFGRVVLDIAPALETSLELWDRRVLNDNFRERENYVTDFMQARDIGLEVPGYMPPRPKMIGTFTVRGGSLSVKGTFMNTKKSKLRTSRVEIYKIDLEPEASQEERGAIRPKPKTMVLMYWPVPEGFSVLDGTGQFVKEIELAISDVSSTATMGTIKEWPIEKGTFKMRVSEDAKKEIESELKSNIVPKGVLIDAYNDKKAKRTVAILIPHEGGKIDHLAFFWEA